MTEAAVKKQRDPSVTIELMPNGSMKRVEHKKLSTYAATVDEIEPAPRKKVTAIDEFRQMAEAEKRLQESYNSLSHFLKMHRPCDDGAIVPISGTFLFKMFVKGQLNRKQLTAWHWLYGDIKTAKGSTNGMISSAEGSASSADYATRQMERSRPGHSTYWNSQAARLQTVLESLRAHEYGLLQQVVRDYLHHDGYKEIHAHTLPYLGGILTNYKDNRQQIAAAVSAIQRLLSSVGEAYGVPDYTR